MAPTTRAALSDFWEFLHAALGLQHGACRLAEQGRLEEAALYERQAMSLLLEATCLLGPGEPALTTVRQLAAAGLGRLHALKRRSDAAARQTRRSTTSPPRVRRRRVAVEP